MWCPHNSNYFERKVRNYYLNNGQIDPLLFFNLRNFKKQCLMKGCSFYLPVDS